MIVSEKHKIVFIAIPKTGTRSIYDYLKTNYSGRLIGDHRTVIPAKYNNYYSFTTCRNPYDRAVSIWWSTCKRNNDKKGFIENYLKDENTFLNFCRNIKKIDSEVFPVTKKQVNWVRKNRIDKIIKFETLDEGFKNLPFNKEKKDLLILNPTVLKTRGNPEPREKDYKKYLCPESIKLIEEYYKEDFDYFKYSKIVL
jgi:hypothetical protein